MSESEHDTDSGTETDVENDEGIDWDDPGLTRPEAVMELHQKLGYRYRSPRMRKGALNSYIAYLTGEFYVKPGLIHHAGELEFVPDSGKLRAEAEACARSYLAGDGVWTPTSIDRPLRSKELNLMVAALREASDMRDRPPTRLEREEDDDGE